MEETRVKFPISRSGVLGKSEILSEILVREYNDVVRALVMQTSEQDGVRSDVI